MYCCRKTCEETNILFEFKKTFLLLFLHTNCLKVKMIFDTKSLLFYFVLKEKYFRANPTWEQKKIVQNEIRIIKIQVVVCKRV